MSLVLIERGGERKHLCVWCRKAKGNTYCVNPERRKINRSYLCEDCHVAILRTIEENYREQIAAGVPNKFRAVSLPLNGAYGARMDDESRLLIRRIDRENTAKSA